MSKITFITTATLIILGGTISAQAQQDYCREFTSNVMIGNRMRESVGTACLNPDGSWQIVSGNNAGATFYDNGANGYGSNNVTYVQQPNVTYVQPQPVNYIWRERVYMPTSSTIIIGNGYNRYPRYYNTHYNSRPWGWNQGRGHQHGAHHHGMNPGRNSGRNPGHSHGGNHNHR
jgi:hypothetical protein